MGQASQTAEQEAHCLSAPHCAMSKLLEMMCSVVTEVKKKWLLFSGDVESLIFWESIQNFQVEGIGFSLSLYGDYIKYSVLSYIINCRE